MARGKDMTTFIRNERGMSLLELIVAMIIFAIGLLSLGSMIPYSTRKLMQAKARTTSVTLAQRFIDEIASKTFDEKEADGTLDLLDEVTPADLTPPASLGPDAGEDWSTYDDIDDYNGTVIDTIPSFPRFKAAFTVSYALASGDTTSSTQTFYKRITAIITPRGGNEPVSLSTVISYKGQ